MQPEGLVSDLCAGSTTCGSGLFIPQSSGQQRMVTPQDFQYLTGQTFLPEVDLFASEVNTKLDRFYAKGCCPLVEESDALSATWVFQTAYAFPPMPLIRRFLHRVSREQKMILAILPDWPGRPWYPMLWSLSCQPPLPLPKARPSSSPRRSYISWLGY